MAQYVCEVFCLCWLEKKKRIYILNSNSKIVQVMFLLSFHLFQASVASLESVFQESEVVQSFI